MRVRTAVAVSLCAVLAVAVIVIGMGVTASAGPLQPVTGDEAEELLAAVRLGCEDAQSRVTTSAGSITRHEWFWRPNGELLETETTYYVVSDRDRFRAIAETRYIKNEWDPEGTGLPVNSPGTVQRLQIAYDGETVTKYEPDRQLAVIAGPSSGLARELRNIQIFTLNPGTGLPVLESTPTESRTPIEARVLGREVVDGDDCIVYESGNNVVHRDGSTVTYYDHMWINPFKGFTVARSEGGVRGGPYGEGVSLTRAEVSVRQYSDDLWGLSRVQEEQYQLDATKGRYLAMRSTCTFADDYQLAPPVTEDMLAIKLPSGTRVRNELIDTEYTVP